jgi:hypothetical protein
MRSISCEFREADGALEVPNPLRPRTRTAEVKLPNGINAVVDIVKLRDYCLNSRHPEGRHKARMFRATLGMEREDAEEL